MRANDLARAGTVCVGCLLFGWAVVTLPLFWRSAAANRDAADILGGHSVPTELILRDIADVETDDTPGHCGPTSKRSAAVLWLNLYRDAMVADRVDLLDARLEKLVRSLREALHCSPSDSYLWLLLFSAENTAKGFEPEHLDYLKKSYALGPREGWVAIKRSPVALAMLPALDAPLAATVLDEFASLVEDGLYEETAATFATTNPAVRDRLLARLADLPEADRRGFARALEVHLPFIAVPGIVRENDQPWRR